MGTRTSIELSWLGTGLVVIDAAIIPAAPATTANRADDDGAASTAAPTTAGASVTRRRGARASTFVTSTSAARRMRNGGQVGYRAWGHLFSTIAAFVLVQLSLRVVRTPIAVADRYDIAGRDDRI